MDEQILAQLAHPFPDTQEHRGCFACYRGVVYIGHVVEDPESSEEIEVIEAVRCRRCQSA